MALVRSTLKKKINSEKEYILFLFVLRGSEKVNFNQKEFPAIKKKDFYRSNKFRFDFIGNSIFDFFNIFSDLKIFIKTVCSSDCIKNLLGELFDN